MKNKKIKTLTAIALSTLLVISYSPITASAANTSNVTKNIQESSPSKDKSIVSPDTPVSFTLNNNEAVLKALHLNVDGTSNVDKDTFGVLISDGTNDYLETLSNGNISIDINDSNIKLNVTHETLTRYTTYTAQLLTGSLFNKYQSQVNSNGNSKAFSKIKDSEEILKTISFKTGSDIGEASKWTLGSFNDKPSVIDGTTVTLEATDDYGNTATSGSVELTKAETYDGTPLSNTFNVTQKVEVADGKAELQITNHETQKVIVGFDAKGSYDDNIMHYSVIIDFKAGPVAKATITTQNSGLIAGNTTEISGQAQDIYGNIIKSNSIDLEASDGTIDATLTDDSGNFKTIFKAPTNLNQENGLTESVDISVETENGDKIATSTVKVSPDKASKATLKTTSVKAGTVAKLEGILEDQYGNLALPTDITATVSNGIVDTTGKSDNMGNFALNYSAPKNLNQTNGISEKNKLYLGLGVNISVNILDFEVVPDAANKIVLDPITNVASGEPITITGKVTDQYGNLVEDNTPVKILNGSSTIANGSTINGEFSVSYTLGDNQTLNIVASSGSASSATVVVSTVSNNDDKDFTINVQNDVQVSQTGNVSFEEGTWTYNGDRVKYVNPDGEFVFSGKGIMGSYSHPLDVSLQTATFEAEVKTFANDGYHGFNNMMLIRTGNTGFSISLYSDKVEIYDNIFVAPIVTVPVNGTIYHTYRLVKDLDKGTLYIDGKLIKSFTLVSGSGFNQHSFGFGDGTSLSGFDNVYSYFKSVKIAPNKALYLN